MASLLSVSPGPEVIQEKVREHAHHEARKIARKKQVAVGKPGTSEHRPVREAEDDEVYKDSREADDAEPYEADPLLSEVRLEPHLGPQPGHDVVSGSRAWT